MIEPLLLTTTLLKTFVGAQHLTNASSFFYEQDGRLFVITSRHVMFDQPSGHRPDRIVIELHNDVDNLANTVKFSMPLYTGHLRNWRQGLDSAGAIDVAAMEIDRDQLPANAVYKAFTREHLLPDSDGVDIGTPILVVGYPLGFIDALHRTAVVRVGIVASSFGLRFQGQGYFLTDARTHRGSSGAPVVMRSANADANDGLPWKLLGVHSARFDIGSRDVQVDEALGLNCAWYADFLATLCSG